MSDLIDRLNEKLRAYFPAMPSHGQRGVKHDPESFSTHVEECRSTPELSGQVIARAHVGSLEPWRVGAIKLTKSNTEKVSSVTDFVSIEDAETSLGMSVSEWTTFARRLGWHSDAPQSFTVVPATLPEGTGLVLPEKQYREFAESRGLDPDLGILQFTSLEPGCGYRGTVRNGGELEYALVNKDFIQEKSIITDKAMWAFQSRITSVTVGYNMLLTAWLGSQAYPETWRSGFYQHLRTQYIASISDVVGLVRKNSGTRSTAEAIVRSGLPLPVSQLAKFRKSAETQIKSKFEKVRIRGVAGYVAGDSGLPEGVTVAPGKTGIHQMVLVRHPILTPASGMVPVLMIGKSSRTNIRKALIRHGIKPCESLVTRILDLAHHGPAGSIVVNPTAWKRQMGDFDGDAAFAYRFEHNAQLPERVPGFDIASEVRESVVLMDENGKSIPIKFKTEHARIAHEFKCAEVEIGIDFFKAIQHPLWTATDGESPTAIIEALARFATVYQTPIAAKKKTIRSGVITADELLEMVDGKPDHPSRVVGSIVKKSRSMRELHDKINKLSESFPMDPMVNTALDTIDNVLDSSVEHISDKDWHTVVSMLMMLPGNAVRREKLTNIVSTFAEIVEADFPEFVIGTREVLDTVDEVIKSVEVKVSATDVLINYAAAILGELSIQEFAWLAVGDDQMRGLKRGLPRYWLALNVANKLGLDLSELRNSLGEIQPSVSPVFPNGFVLEPEESGEIEDYVDPYVGLVVPEPDEYDMVGSE